MLRRRFFAPLLAGPLLLRARGSQKGFSFREVSPDSLELNENGKPVFVYHHGMVLGAGAPERYRRSSYLHPVWAPDGTVLTDDFPADHYHHRGLFWAWPVVMIDGKRHDGWMALHVKHKFEKWLHREAKPDSARLAMENGWYAGERKVVAERVEIRAHPERDARRRLDFTLRMEATEAPIELRGAPEEQKGYGGFSVRFAPRKDTVITAASGRQAKDSDMQPNAWAQLEATYEGRRAGLRIDIDAANPGYPNGWCLRHYGFLGVNYPGRESLMLERGKPVVLRYRVTTYAVGK